MPLPFELLIALEIDGFRSTVFGEGDIRLRFVRGLCAAEDGGEGIEMAASDTVSSESDSGGVGGGVSFRRGESTAGDCFRALAMSKYRHVLVDLPALRLYPS